MSAALQQHLERLRVPHPAVQQAAVSGVFDVMGRTPSLLAANRDAAIAQCLSLDQKCAVEAAVQALLIPGTVAGGAGSDTDTVASALLLTALSVASSSTAEPLAAGILQLFQQELRSQVESHTAATGSSGSRSSLHTTWRGHLLSKAVLSNVAAAQSIVLGVTRMLTHATDAGSMHRSTSNGSVGHLFAVLRPFLSFVLLDPQLQQQHPLLPLQLHTSLARVACCTSSSASQQQVLKLLVDHLPALALRMPPASAAVSAQQLAAAAVAVAAAVADIMDVVESCSSDPDSPVVSRLAGHLVCLCFDAAQAQTAALLQQLLAALARMSGYWPDLLLAHAADLGMLLTQTSAAGTPALGASDARAVLAVLAQLLQQATTSQAPAAVSAAAAGGGETGMRTQLELPALLLLPLLQQIAFGTSKDVKQWAGHTLALLNQLGSSGGSSGGAGTEAAAGHPPSMHGAAAAVQAAQQLLHHLWQHSSGARHWLASVQLTLASRAGSSSSEGTGSRDKPARDLQQLDSSVLLVVCALLQHPDAAVQRAALRAAVAGVAAAPLLGLSLLPLLVQQLQHQIELFSSGKHQHPSRLLLELLRALPAAGRHPAALPFVVRTLQPLLSAGAPEVLQAVGLRLVCRLWHGSGGRAYQQLRTAILGFAAPGQQPGLALRVARAECLRDICGTEPDRAVELVAILQECIADEAPAVQAIGLDCIALLCEADVLEFYAAWRVVHRQMPRLPEHSAAAAAWVRLLGSGGLDAAVQPVAAAAIVDALWLAARHDAPQVRRQAYASLASFQFETLEAIDALRPLWAYVALLQQERHQQQQLLLGAGSNSMRQQRAAAAAAAECEALVKAALAQEHDTRRRPAAGAAGAVMATAGAAATSRERGSAASAAAGSAGPGAAAVMHRLQSVLPKQLLGGSAATAAELLQRLPDLSPAAVLYFYAPPPPPASSRTVAAAAVAARQAAADYQAVFLEVLNQQQPVAALPTGDAGASADMLAAWAAFMRRWLAAVRAAAKQQHPDQQQAAADAAMEVWAVVGQQLESASATPAAVGNAAWAAAALCCCTQQPVQPLVAAVNAALRGAAAGQQQHPAAVQRAAAAASGAIAEAVRVTLGTPVMQQLLELLQQQLEQQQSEADAAGAAAAATGLGLACASLCRGVAADCAAAAAGSCGLPTGVEQLVKGALGSLLSVLGKAWPAATSSIASAAAAAGLLLPPVNGSRGPGQMLQAAAAAAAALAAGLPAVAASLPVPGLLQALLQPSMAQLSRHQQQPGEGAAAAAAWCALLAAVAAAGYSSGTVSSANVTRCLQLLLSLADSSGSTAAPDGQPRGAAAAAAAELLTAVLGQGYAPVSQAEEPSAVLRLLLAAPEAAARLPHAAAAKRGAAAGIAALLAAAVVETSSSQYKAAVTVLEGLALKEGDPRARKACALPLAALCYTNKRSGGSGGGVGGIAATATAAGGGSSSSRGLQQLPADGALRPLLESLLEGRWVLPAGGDSQEVPEQQQQLAAAAAAAILRCLVAAERLPAMNYTTLCRRLLRTYSVTASTPAAAAAGTGVAAAAAAAAGVELAVVAFAAAHGSQQQQQYQLADLAAELLSQRHLSAAPPGTQQQLLLRLPQLLAALPEAQAVATLQAVCQGTADAVASRGSSSGGSTQLLFCLLRSLQQLLSPGSSAGLLLAAQHAVAGVLLPVLPAPGRYPLHLTAALLPAAAEAADVQQQEKLLSLPQRCWAGALRCLQLLPQQQLEELLQQPLLLQQLPVHAAFASAALVAAGTLDGRALQHPRNLLLLGGRGDSFGGISEQRQGLIAVVVGRAVATLPASQQQQWLLDVLEACKTCANPAGAFQLAACITASSGAAAISTTQLAADHIVGAAPAGRIELALPATLPLLLSSPSWQRSAASVAMLLARLAAALERLAAMQELSSVGNRQLLLDYRQLLRSCLLACRHSLPLDTWPLLAAML